jgi:chromosome segregation ATPase
MAKKLEPIKIPSAKNDDQPASRKMLRLVRDELKSEVRSLSRKMDTRFEAVDAQFKVIDSQFKGIDSQFKSIDLQFKSIDSRFKSIDAQFKSIDARFKGIDSRFDDMESRFEGIDSRFDKMDFRFQEMTGRFDSLIEEIRTDHIRTQMLLEEQHSNNRIVLEGLQALWQRQERIEKAIPGLAKN